MGQNINMYVALHGIESCKVKNPNVVTLDVKINITTYNSCNAVCCNIIVKSQRTVCISTKASPHCLVSFTMDEKFKCPFIQPCE